MPHSILEYSDNVIETEEFQAFWGRLHPLLVSQAHCRLQDLKSRAYCCENFRMGDGDPRGAFVHLTIRLLEGRDPETLGRIGAAVMELMRAHFKGTLAQRRCDLTLELAGMRPDCYFKASSGSD